MAINAGVLVLLLLVTGAWIGVTFNRTSEPKKGAA